MLTLNPLFFNNLPNEAAVIPFPNEETTPPVTNTYLVFLLISLPPNVNLFLTSFFVSFIMIITSFRMGFLLLVLIT
ncbi:hypothetical protein UT300008_14720 [Clostridium perfringens]